MHVDTKSDYFFLKRLVPCCAINESQDFGVCNYNLYCFVGQEAFEKKSPSVFNACRYYLYIKQPLKR